MTRPADAIKYLIVPFTRGAVLDLGATHADKLFPHFLSVSDLGDVKDSLDDLSSFEDGKCDAVVASYTGVHDVFGAMQEWWRVLAVGGFLVLHEPDEEADEEAHMLRMIALRDASGMGWERVFVFSDEDDGNLSVFRKTWVPECETIAQRHEKSVCVCRFGGFGDMLQAANILPQLKRDGWHVTVMTTPKGQDVIRLDPHVDAWLIQDDNQVPNHLLGEYWAVQAKQFDRFINLSESVEGTLLAIPGRTNHAWPDSVRRVELNRNYLEWTAQLAEVAYSNETRFYGSTEENLKVTRYYNDLRAELDPQPFGVIPKHIFVITWALAGSSVHKFYPWQDSVIAAILQELPQAVVILTGDFACQILEQGWEVEPRVRTESGNMSIRDTLALAQQSHCVVGPETGVLNAVAFEDNAKVLMLSHSSHENLTKHWTNTTALEPVDTPCYPCHRLHYGSEFCHLHDQTGAAMCQLSIMPDRVMDAIRSAYYKWTAR
jgi:ADP-heptose:LPS heptosyltransferase